MKKLIFSSLGKRKIQTLSVILVVAASVTVLFALFLIYSGVRAGVHLSEERGGAELVVIPQSARGNIDETTMLFTGAPVPMYMSEDVADKVAAIPGVAQTSTQFLSQTLSASCCSVGTNAETRIIGFDPSTDWVVSPLSDENLSGGLEPNQVLLGAEVAGNSDGTVIIKNERYEVVGRLAKTGSDIDYSIMMDISQARAEALSLEGYDHYWEEYGQPSSLISTVLVNLDDSLDSAQRENVLRRIKNLDGVYVVERSEVIDSSQKQLQSAFGLMLAVGIAMVIVSILQLFARFYTMAWDRKSELALYRAVGAMKREISALIGFEAAFLSVTGIVIGLIFGFILSRLGAAWLLADGAFPYVESTVTDAVLGIIAIVVVYALITFLSIVAPLRQIGRIDPSLAMRQSDIG